MKEMSGFNLKDKLSLLMTQRDALEIEADAITSELTSPGLNGQPPAGLRGSLVDSEDYPRGDIDIYNVVNKRKRLSEINTDHKAVMKQIEETLAAIYASYPAESTVSSTPSSSIASLSLLDDRGIAKLDEILEGSPAFSAGISDGDVLLQFGEIKRTTPDALKSIAKLVGESVNKPIKLVLRRKDELVNAEITPASWGGRGLLGCHLSPIQ